MKLSQQIQTFTHTLGLLDVARRTYTEVVDDIAGTSLDMSEIWPNYRSDLYVDPYSTIKSKRVNIREVIIKYFHYTIFKGKFILGPRYLGSFLSANM